MLIDNDKNKNIELIIMISIILFALIIGLYIDDSLIYALIKVIQILSVIMGIPFIIFTILTCYFYFSKDVFISKKNCIIDISISLSIIYLMVYIFNFDLPPKPYILN